MLIKSFSDPPKTSRSVRFRTDSFHKAPAIRGRSIRVSHHRCVFEDLTGGFLILRIAIHAFEKNLCRYEFLNRRPYFSGLLYHFGRFFRLNRTSESCRELRSAGEFGNCVPLLKSNLRELMAHFPESGIFALQQHQAHLNLSIGIRPVSA